MASSNQNNGHKPQSTNNGSNGRQDQNSNTPQLPGEEANFYNLPQPLINSFQRLVAAAALREGPIRASLWEQALSRVEEEVSNFHLSMTGQPCGPELAAKIAQVVDALSQQRPDPSVADAVVGALAYECSTTAADVVAALGTSGNSVLQGSEAPTSSGSHWRDASLSARPNPKDRRSPPTARRNPSSMLAKLRASRQGSDSPAPSLWPAAVASPLRPEAPQGPGFPGRVDSHAWNSSLQNEGRLTFE